MEFEIDSKYHKAYTRPAPFGPYQNPKEDWLEGFSDGLYLTNPSPPLVNFWTVGCVQRYYDGFAAGRWEKYNFLKLLERNKI